MPILRRYTTTLDCVLKDVEILSYGRELASVNQEITTEEDRQNSLKQELKARIAGLEARRTELSAKISRGKELREVQIEILADFKAGTATEVRLDTGEVHRERPLREEEKQPTLPSPRSDVSVEDTDKVVEKMKLRKADEPF